MSLLVILILYAIFADIFENLYKKEKILTHIFNEIAPICFESQFIYYLYIEMCQDHVVIFKWYVDQPSVL